ncbi:MAG: TonB-dependent receptor [Nevskiaceae bacterium]|jgi:iron complex outermembrane receptor protein|nr:TonB-dependent receptor [Nevskiaceae bacterium]
MGNRYSRNVSRAVALALGSALAYAPLQVLAADDAGDLGSLEEVVVTAQFREQNLQQTPLAITAITAEQLAEKGFVNIQDLTQAAPSVELRHTGSAGGKTMAAFIRGVGASDYNFNIEPGVAFYMDDVYLGPSFGTLIEFVDLERAEILRGPQGTLSGKNAIGGAVRLVTQKPRGDDTGYAEVETGSRSLLRMRAAFDVGLTDNLAMRVSAYSATQEGLVKLYDFACMHPDQLGDQSAPFALNDATPPQNCHRGNLGNTDVQAARLQFRWTPSDDVEVNLAGNYVDDNARGAADVLLRVNPAGFSAYNVPGTPVGQSNPYFQHYYGIAYDERFLPPNRFSSYATFYDPVYELDYPPENTLETKELTLNVDWKINDNLALKSITGYRDISGSWAYDSDSSPLQTDAVYDTMGHEHFSQEVRLSGLSFNDRFNWTVGGYYYNADETDVGSIQAAIFNFYIWVDSKAKNENYAGFAHGEFDITDQLKLIGGVRYTTEDKTYHFIEGDVAGTPSTAFVDPVLLAQGIFKEGLDFPGQTSYDRTDWRVGLQYQLTDDHMIYANIATGFRGGGFNPRPSNIYTAIAFGPEKLTSFEVGHRSEFLDHKIRWNNTAYYSKYEDMILSARVGIILPGAAFPAAYPVNAAKARIWGIESEFVADVNEWVSFNASGSYSDFKYQDLGAAGENPGSPALTANQRFTPDWKFNAGMRAVLPILQDAGEVSFNLDYAWQSKQSPDVQNLPELIIDAYGTANARLTFTTLDQKWAVSLSGANILDEAYFYNKSNVSGNFQTKGNPAPGAEWALSVRRNFN